MALPEKFEQKTVRLPVSMVDTINEITASDAAVMKEARDFTKTVRRLITAGIEVSETTKPAAD